jgi:Uma2 family endonuclease
LRRDSKLTAPLKARDARVFGSSLSLLISREPLTCRAPDIAVYSRERIALDENEIFCSAPDLIVEVISPPETKRRKERKLAYYARIGVPEVWIVSPQGQTVEVRRLKDSKLLVEKVIVDGALDLSQFPGVSVPIAGIWAQDLA